MRSPGTHADHVALAQPPERLAQQPLALRGLLHTASPRYKGLGSSNTEGRIRFLACGFQMLCFGYTSI